MTVPRQELPQYLWAAVTAFNMENGKLIIQRGMMGIEKLCLGLFVAKTEVLSISSGKRP